VVPENANALIASKNMDSRAAAKKDNSAQ